ncbi:hypothetical protein GPJ56_006178 [Histomonas meleagridis]|uniref:uncharacterized protein n=1 Tax=Histomonas meleagridis TaxID=135588 RepID=UPI003559F46F|nr:hypothetical protein GPJ56_006178 [Histomonas meleagridis]KAH0797006.1 hypothetical protein GO595_010899 [Histomonas meleagridis]
MVPHSPNEVAKEARYRFNVFGAPHWFPANKMQEEFIQHQIALLHKKFFEKPLSGILTLIEPQSEFVPNPKMIQEKVDNKAYLTLFDFALDIRCMIIAGQKILEKDQVAVYGLTDLSQWFENQLNKSPRNEEEEHFQKILKLRKQLVLVRRGMSLSAAKITSGTNNSNNKKQKKIAPAPLVNEIQKLLISEATTSQMQMQVLSILKRNIPDFEPAARTTLEMSQISLKCAEELMELLEAARDKRISQEAQNGEKKEDETSQEQTE